MRAMGLDIGSVTVGVSLSDGLKMIASSYTVIRYEQENEELFKKIVDIIKVEVHLSKVDSREDFRKINFIRDVVDETFQGDGALSYIKAVRYLKNKLNVI